MAVCLNLQGSNLNYLWCEGVQTTYSLGPLLDLTVSFYDFCRYLSWNTLEAEKTIYTLAWILRNFATQTCTTLFLELITLDLLCILKKKIFFKLLEGTLKNGAQSFPPCGNIYFNPIILQDYRVLRERNLGKFTGSCHRIILSKTCVSPHGSSLLTPSPFLHSFIHSFSEY